MSTLRNLLTTCLVLPWLAASAGADPFAPVTVTLPPEGQGDIFSPGIRLVADLDENYVEEEYFVSGIVDVFEYDDPPQLHQLNPAQRHRHGLHHADHHPTAREEVQIRWECGRRVVELHRAIRHRAGLGRIGGVLRA